MAEAMWRACWTVSAAREDLRSRRDCLRCAARESFWVRDSVERLWEQMGVKSVYPKNRVYIVRYLLRNPRFSSILRGPLGERLTASKGAVRVPSSSTVMAKAIDLGDAVAAIMMDVRI